MATKIQLVFYSMYGHIYRMAEAVVAGAREVAGTARKRAKGARVAWASLEIFDPYPFLLLSYSSPKLGVRAGTRP